MSYLFVNVMGCYREESAEPGQTGPRLIMVFTVFIFASFGGIALHVHIYTKIYLFEVYIKANFEDVRKIKKITVKFLNFWTPDNFAVIYMYLKFQQRGQTFGYIIKKMQMK